MWRYFIVSFSPASQKHQHSNMRLRARLQAPTMPAFSFRVADMYTPSLLTRFISTPATAVLLAPIALESASQIGASPVPFLFAVAVGASMCFASPFSTPPNALVMPAGQYTFIDYIKVGLPLQLAMGIVMIFVLPLLFPF